MGSPPFRRRMIGMTIVPRTAPVNLFLTFLIGDKPQRSRDSGQARFIADQKEKGPSTRERPKPSGRGQRSNQSAIGRGSAERSVGSIQSVQSWTQITSRTREVVSRAVTS